MLELGALHLDVVTATPESCGKAKQLVAQYSGHGSLGGRML